MGQEDLSQETRLSGFASNHAGTDEETNMTIYKVKMRRRRKQTRIEYRDIEIVFDEQRLANLKDKYHLSQSYIFEDDELASFAEEIDDDDLTAEWTVSDFGDSSEALDSQDLEVIKIEDPLRICLEDINATVCDALDNRPLTLEEAISALTAVRNACSEELSRLINEEDETA